MTEEIKTSTGMNQNVAGLLCYLAGWITGLIFFLIEKENRFVRFHAMQSIITFGSLTVIFMILGFIPFVGWMLMPILAILQLILWIVLMVKAYQGQLFKLPMIGDMRRRIYSYTVGQRTTPVSSVSDIRLRSPSLGWLCGRPLCGRPCRFQNPRRFACAVPSQKPVFASSL